MILLTCNVTQPQMVNVSKRISWEQVSPSGSVQMLIHSGFDTNITNSGLDRSSNTSILSLYANMAGRWRYTCNASIQVPGDPVIAYSQTAEVTAKGTHFMLLCIVEEYL